MDEFEQDPKIGFKVDPSKKQRLNLSHPFMLLIRPGQFFVTWGIHANIIWVLLAAWVLGTSAMSNTAINRTRHIPETLPFDLDTWTKVWLFIIAFGILRGVIFSYGLGGLWTWLRLRICGVRGNQWNRSTRIHCLSKLVEEVPLLLLLIYLTLKYDNLREFIAQPLSLLNLLTALIALMGPVVAFLGVIACFRVRIVWASILFLVLPLVFRLSILGSIAYSMLTSTGSVLLPDTEHPREYQNQVVVFDHPDDWEVVESPYENNPLQIYIESTSDNGAFFIVVQPREDADLVQEDLDRMKAQGYEVTRTSPEPRSMMGVHSGIGADYDLTKDGKQYRMYHLLVHFDVDHDVLFRSIASKRYWDASKRAVFQIVNSISIGDLYQIVPDIENPMEVDRGEFSFQAPGNWHLIESEREPFKNLEVSAKQYSSFSVNIYDRDLSPQDELDMYLRHSIDDVLISYEPMNSWLGLTGVGIKGQLRESLAGFRQFRKFYVPLEDGRIVVIGKYQAESSLDLTNPGYELFENSFKLLVEPSLNDTAIDP